MYTRKIIVCFFFFLLLLLFLSPFRVRCSWSDLCSDGGGDSAVMARGEVNIGAVDKVVLVHIHSLGV